MLVLKTGNKGVTPAYPTQFFDDFEAGNTGRWNFFGIGTPPIQAGTCTQVIDTAGSGGAPATPNGTKILRFEQTDTCENSGDPTQASRQIWWHIHPVMNWISGAWVPGTTNSNWYPGFEIYPGDESGLYSAWYYIPTGTKCVNTTDLPTLLIPETMNSPGMLMEIKDRFDWDGNARDDAQWQTSCKSKADIEAYFGITVPFTPSRADAPLLHTFQPFINGQVPVCLEIPLGELFKLTWELERRQYLKIYVNNVLVDTKTHTHSLYPNQFGNNQTFIGLREYTGNGTAGNGTKPIAWSFAIDRYCRGVGKLWIDRTTNQPLKRKRYWIPFDSGV